MSGYVFLTVCVGLAAIGCAVTWLNMRHPRKARARYRRRP